MAAGGSGAQSAILREEVGLCTNTRSRFWVSRGDFNWLHYKESRSWYQSSDWPPDAGRQPGAPRRLVQHCEKCAARQIQVEPRDTSLPRRGYQGVLRSGAAGATTQHAPLPRDHRQQHDLPPVAGVRRASCGRRRQTTFGANARGHRPQRCRIRHQSGLHVAQLAPVRSGTLAATRRRARPRAVAPACAADRPGSCACSAASVPAGAHPAGATGKGDCRNHLCFPPTAHA